jgi:hypothetical protein
VQAKTQAAKCTRSGWKGGGGDEALGVGARRTSLPISAALLVCRGSETEQASGDGGGGRAGDAGQPRLEAHVRWGWGGLCRNEQRLRRGQDEGDGGGREEVRERMGTGEGGGQKAVM